MDAEQLVAKPAHLVRVARLAGFQRRHQPVVFVEVQRGIGGQAVGMRLGDDEAVDMLDAGQQQDMLQHRRVARTHEDVRQGVAALLGQPAQEGGEVGQRVRDIGLAHRILDTEHGRAQRGETTAEQRPGEIVAGAWQIERCAEREGVQHRSIGGHAESLPSDAIMATAR